MIQITVPPSLRIQATLSRHRLKDNYLMILPLNLALLLREAVDSTNGVSERPLSRYQCRVTKINWRQIRCIRSRGAYRFERNRYPETPNWLVLLRVCCIRQGFVSKRSRVTIHGLHERTTSRCDMRHEKIWNTRSVVGVHPGVKGLIGDALGRLLDARRGHYLPAFCGLDLILKYSPTVHGSQANG